MDGVTQGVAFDGYIDAIAGKMGQHGFEAQIKVTIAGEEPPLDALRELARQGTLRISMEGSQLAWPRFAGDTGDAPPNVDPATGEISGRA